MIRDENVVTATEEVLCDIEIEHGLIATIGDKLPKGERTRSTRTGATCSRAASIATVLLRWGQNPDRVEPVFVEITECIAGNQTIFG